MTTTKRQRPDGPQAMTPAELRMIRQALRYSREDLACADRAAQAIERDAFSDIH